MKDTAFNPLQEALAKGAQAEPHPDEGLLTAFVEGSLLASERRQMLAHLASCATCREVVALAAEAAPVEESAVALPQPSRGRIGSWMLWAGAAAMVALISLPGLIYWEQFQNQPPVAVNRTTPPPASVGPAQQDKAPAQQEITVRQKRAATLPEKKPAALKPAGTPSATAGAMDRLHPASEVGAAPVASPAPLRQANVEAANRPLAGPESMPSIAGVQAEERAPEIPAARSASTFSASSFASVQTPRPMVKAQAFPSLRPRWRINGAGQVERSFGNGAWQAVLPNEKSKMRVVSVFLGSVWIGGENIRLYRSTDNGGTWTPVSLPAKNGSLHAIVHIGFESPQNGTIEAEDGTIWTTTDGGRTWN